MKKEFYDKPIYIITNTLISMIQSNVYFLLCNIPLVAYLVLSTFNPNIFNLLLLFLVLLPIGPSLITLYYVMGKYLREKDMFFSAKYFKTYKTNFKCNLKIWTYFLLIFTILFIDFQYFFLNKTSSGIHIVFLVLIAILSLIVLYAIPIYSHFNIKFKDLLLTSIYYMVKKFPVTILKGAVLFAIYYFSKSIPLIIAFILPVILCFIFMYYDNMMLKELEKRSISKV